MFKILNRIAWMLSIILTIISIIILGWITGNSGDDIFAYMFLSIFFIPLIKFFFLSENFIKSNIIKFNLKTIEYIEENIKIDSISNIGADTEQAQTTNNTDISISKFEESILDTQSVIGDERDLDGRKLEDSVYKLPKIEKSEVKTINHKVQNKYIIYLKDFFSTNPLAKIGGILLALGVFFLMTLIYSNLGPILKVIVGFLIGFIVYRVGTILHLRGYKGEGFVLLGAGILINYIVILFGTFVIDGDISNTSVLSPIITFVLLILNTIFSTLTSFIYLSRNLLLFSLIFAFITPYITGSTDVDTPYVLIVYSLIVAIGGLATSNYYKAKYRDDTSSIATYFISMIGGYLAITIAPFFDMVGFFVAKLIAFNILTILGIWMIYKNNYIKEILPSFLISFIVLSMLMFTGVEISSIYVLLAFIVGLVAIVAGSSFFMIKSRNIGMLYVLLLPLVLVLLMISTNDISYGFALTPVTLVLYLLVFILGLRYEFIRKFTYMGYGVLGVFLIMSNFSLYLNVELDLYSYLTIATTGFVFMIVSYVLSKNKDLSYLYTIGTIIGAFILFPLINSTSEFLTLSLGTLSIYFVFNYLTPFIYPNIKQNNIQNLVLGSVIGAFFVGFKIYIVSVEYISSVYIGLFLILLGVIYAGGGYLAFTKLIRRSKSDVDKYKNTIYTYLGITITLLTVGLGIIFSGKFMIIPLILVIESSLLLYLYIKIIDKKIYIASLVLNVIGVLYAIPGLLSAIIFSGMQSSGIFVLILISRVTYINLYIIRGERYNFKNILFKITHIIITLGSVLAIYSHIDLSDDIYPITSIIMLYLSAYYYEYLRDNFMRNIYLIRMILLFTTQVFLSVDHDINISHYIFTMLSIVGLIGVLVFFGRNSSYRRLFTIIGFYLFVITSVYLYKYTLDYLSLTIYWGILSTILIHLGIEKLPRQLRTIGLYILIFTLFKIVLYDVWSVIDSPILRVVAFIFVGGIMVYISILYDRLKLSLRDDFNISKVFGFDRKNQDRI